MDIKELDKALVALVEKKNQLAGLSYDDPKYDEIEEELHDMEDDFNDQYGEFLEDALHMVHDDLCPDNDVLLPIAYLADKYDVVGTRKDGTKMWSAPANHGVLVEVDDYPGIPTWLVLVPSPTRLVLNVKGKPSEDVWVAKETV